jgi:hypothetical protein
LKHVLAHLDKDWDWEKLSSRFSMEDMLANPELPWYWRSISANRNITIDDVLKHPDFEWNWKALSSNPNIVVGDTTIMRGGVPFIIPWCFKGASSNPTLTTDMIFNNLDKQWDWWGIIHNEFEKNETVRARLIRLADEEDERIAHIRSEASACLLSELADIVAEYSWAL